MARWRNRSGSPSWTVNIEASSPATAGWVPRGDRPTSAVLGSDGRSTTTRGRDDDAGALRATRLGQGHGRPAPGCVRIPGLLHRPADARVGGRPVRRTAGAASDDGGRGVRLRRAGGPDRPRVHPRPAGRCDRGDPRRLPARSCAVRCLARGPDRPRHRGRRRHPGGRLSRPHAGAHGLPGLRLDRPHAGYRLRPLRRGDSNDARTMGTRPSSTAVSRTTSRASRPSSRPGMARACRSSDSMALATSTSSPRSCSPRSRASRGRRRRSSPGASGPAEPVSTVCRRLLHSVDG